MKLIQTENRNGTPNGYFDPSTGFHYTVDGEHPFWVIARLPTGAAVRLTQVFVEYDDADAELDRIAALIEGKAPAQGWIAGSPPLVDGAWFLVMHQGEPVAVHCHAPNDLPWTDSAGNDYPCSEFTHHLPTPIQPPKES